MPSNDAPIARDDRTVALLRPRPGSDYGASSSHHSQRRPARAERKSKQPCRVGIGVDASKIDRRLQIVHIFIYYIKVLRADLVKTVFFMFLISDNSTI